MDLNAEVEVSRERLERHKKMAEVRKAKLIYKDEHYRKTSFVSADEREVLLKFIGAISEPLKKIKSIEEKCDISKKEYALDLGFKAMALKETIRNINSKRPNKSSHIKFRRYICIHFKEDIKRIDEYMAAARIVTLKGANSELQLWTLIQLGQGSESKNPEKRKLIGRIIEENNIDDVPLGNIPATELSWKIKNKLDHDSNTTITTIETALTQSKLLLKQIQELNILICENPGFGRDSKQLAILTNQLKANLRKIAKKCLKTKMLIKNSNRIRSK